MSIVYFLIIFSIVVLSHEFGHFIVAKSNGIHVVEFSMGMGPALIKFNRGGTLYALRLLPFGGACMFENEDGMAEGKEKKGAFTSASVWARIATVFAGPLFNFILAFLFSLILVGYVGSDKPTVVSLVDGYPAQEAGIQTGDVITKINGERVYLYREVSIISYMNRGETMKIQYERDGKSYTAQVTPIYDDTQKRYFVGISGGEKVNCANLKVFQYSYYEVRYWVKYSIKSLEMLFQGKVSKDEISGPVGIAQMVGDVYEESKAYGLPTVVINMINIAILLSVNLGVINLLPLPALDGGRLVFLIIEAIRRKPVPPEKEGFVHFMGFVALMILMVLIVMNDIMKLFK